MNSPAGRQRIRDSLSGRASVDNQIEQGPGSFGPTSERDTGLDLTSFDDWSENLLE